MAQEQNPHITLERDGPLAAIRLDRPERKNAISPTMWEALDAFIHELERSSARCVVVTGTGDAFCAGMDIAMDNPLAAELLQAMQDKDAVNARALVTRFRGVLDRFAALPMPTVAAINGLAYGGGLELALVCDVRVAQSGAKLCFPEVKLGMIPDLGGTARMAHLVGPSLAAGLILTARRITAAEARQWGLVLDVFEPAEFNGAVRELANTIMGHGPAALREIKKVLRGAPGARLNETLEAETEAAVAAIVSGEPLEGLVAFAEKRPPRFNP